MKNFLISLPLLFVLFISAPALAGISISCDIGDINISGGNIKFENGQFNATGSFSISFHGKDSLSYGYFSDSSSSSGSPYLVWT